MRHQLLSGLSWKLILSESIFMCDFYLWRHFIFLPSWKKLRGGLVCPRACDHGRLSSGLRGQGRAIEGPTRVAQGHQFTICESARSAHTHSHTQRPARVRTLSHRNSLHPPIPQSCYCVLHLCSVQLKTDRIRASLHPPALSLPPGFPLIHHSSLPS